MNSIVHLPRSWWGQGGGCFGLHLSTRAAPGHSRHSVCTHEVSRCSRTNRSVLCWISFSVYCKHNEGSVWSTDCWQKNSCLLREIGPFGPLSWCYWIWGWTIQKWCRRPFVNASLHADQVLWFLRRSLCVRWPYCSCWIWSRCENSVSFLLPHGVQCLINKFSHFLSNIPKQIPLGWCKDLQSFATVVRALCWMARPL